MQPPKLPPIHYFLSLGNKLFKCFNYNTTESAEIIPKQAEIPANTTLHNLFPVVGKLSDNFCWNFNDTMVIDDKRVITLTGVVECIKKEKILFSQSGNATQLHAELALGNKYEFKFETSLHFDYKFILANINGRLTSNTKLLSKTQLRFDLLWTKRERKWRSTFETDAYKRMQRIEEERKLKWIKVGGIKSTWMRSVAPDTLNTHGIRAFTLYCLLSELHDPFINTSLRLFIMRHFHHVHWKSLADYCSGKASDLKVRWTKDVGNSISLESMEVEFPDFILESFSIWCSNAKLRSKRAAAATLPVTVKLPKSGRFTALCIQGTPHCFAETLQQMLPVFIRSRFSLHYARDCIAHIWRGPEAMTKPLTFRDLSGCFGFKCNLPSNVPQIVLQIKRDASRKEKFQRLSLIFTAMGKRVVFQCKYKDMIDHGAEVRLQVAIRKSDTLVLKALLEILKLEHVLKANISAYSLFSSSMHNTFVTTAKIIDNLQVVIIESTANNKWFYNLKTYGILQEVTASMAIPSHEKAFTEGLAAFQITISLISGEVACFKMGNRVLVGKAIEPSLPQKLWQIKKLHDISIKPTNEVQGRIYSTV